MLPLLAAAETKMVVVEPTGLVAKVQVTDALPAGTVTVAGMEATALAPVVTVNVTTVSLASARPKVTVAVLLPPPTREFGLKLRSVGVLGVTVSDAVLVPPLAFAETCTTVRAETFAVTTVKAALVEPAGTVTEAGIELTAAEPLVTVRVTGVSAGAAAINVTVPVLLAPATTVFGEKARVLGVSAFTVNEAVLVTP